MPQEKPILMKLPPIAKRINFFSLISFKYFRFNTKESLILLTTSIAVIQTLLHLFAINAYGFHEDELLYMVLGNHLAWGYKETGPLIAVIGNISKSIFGDSLPAVRIIPVLCAGALVHFTGMLTIKLGGKHLAVIIACTAMAFSPAFLASGGLFIPQVFDELFWLLTVYLVVCYIQKPNNNYLYALGLIVGLGILLKYTLILYVAGILIGLAFSAELRKLFFQKAFYLSVFIAALILLPHLLWQYENNFPALVHYHELKETQLNYLYRLDFLKQQLLVNGPSAIVWLVGIVYIFYDKKLKLYRFIGVAFLTAMLVLALLKGKPYYGFGAYPALFAVGALCLERWLSIKSLTKKIAVLAILVAPNLLLTFIALPVLPIETAASVFSWARYNLAITFPIKWEDQKIHSVNQNYAAMIGWDELAKKTSTLYLTLSPAKQKETIIYTESYGIASALTYYAKFYPLPKVVSLNGSFAVWAPKNIDDRFVIFYSKAKDNSQLNLDSLKTQNTVANPFSQLYGMRIELSTDNEKGKLERLLAMSEGK